MEQNASAAERFQAAFEYHGAGELEQAERLYRTILASEPQQPDALHFLGVLLHQRGDSDGALELIRESLTLRPGRADWHNDLGNILTARGELRQAADAFRQAATLQPADSTPWNNLGAVLQHLGQLEEAEQSFRRAIEINPEFGDALNNLGHLLNAQGRDLEAAEYICRAYVLEPTREKPKAMLGTAWYKLGRYAEAAEIYRQWLQEEPDNPTAAHFLAACSGNDVPERCSEAYIEKTFDEFAASFDEHLQGLSYRGPEMMAQLLKRVAVAGRKLDILDGGCGTGLCGPVLAPYAASLTGVDLSGLMLQQARTRGYNTLEKADLVSYLQQHPASFDLIAAADTLIYFGELNPLLAALHDALRPNGLFMFTVEHDANYEDSYHLHPHGRYSHGQAYLAARLRANGFNMVEMIPGIVRIEFGTPVQGLAVAARKE